MCRSSIWVSGLKMITETLLEVAAKK